MVCDCNKIQYGNDINISHLIKARNKYLIPFCSFQIKLKRIQNKPNGHDTNKQVGVGLSLNNYN